MTRIIFPFLFVFFVACAKDKGKPVPAAPQNPNGCDTPSFATQIQPILNNNCVSCHGSGNPNGDYTYYAGTYQKIQGANPFKNRVLENPSNPMPPSGQLPADKRALIDCWLKAGAPNN